MAIFDAELRRVQGGFSEDDDDAKLLPVRVFFTADDPAVVVARARDVLAQVIQRMDSWPAAQPPASSAQNPSRGAGSYGTRSRASVTILTAKVAAPILA
jgi:hypothetical protein